MLWTLRSGNIFLNSEWSPADVSMCSCQCFTCLETGGNNAAPVFMLRCICGLLKDKCRVLVTHQLQHLRAADHIMVLKEVSVTD